MIAFVMAAIFLSAACSPACPPQIWAATAPAIKSDDFNSTHKLNISLPSKFRRKNSTIKCDGLNSTYKTGQSTLRFPRTRKPYLQVKISYIACFRVSIATGIPKTACYLDALHVRVKTQYFPTIHEFV